MTVDEILLHPKTAADEIARLTRREQELLDANNRYLERARAAEDRARKADARFDALNTVLADALRTAINHVEHMAAWIGGRQEGYSFESLGEDMGCMRDALVSAEGRKGDRPSRLVARPARSEPPIGGDSVRA